jgi:hypothetical protein
MLGELRNIRTRTLVGMALAILDIERPLGEQEISELEQIQRELQHRRRVGQLRVIPVSEEEQRDQQEQVRTIECGRR